MAHALFSPSSAHKWIRCAGALAMEQGAPDSTSAAADQGTAAHHLAAMVLTDGTYYTRAYEGRTIRVINGQVWERGDPRPPLLQGQRNHSDREFAVDEDMCEAVQTYVDAIRGRIEEYKAAGAIDTTILIENRVDISNVVNHPEQFGTSDVIIVATWADGTSLIGVEDLKYGYRLVNADHNEQLMIYALGALEQYEMLGNFTRARMVIHQPNRDHVSDWECSIEELREFGAKAGEAAALANDMLKLTKGIVGKKRDEILATTLTPGEKQCQWCKRKGNCPALAGFVEEVTGVDFDDLTKDHIETLTSEPVAASLADQEKQGEHLARLRAAVPLLDIFARGILAMSDAFVLGGGKMPGWKAVQGKKGNRKWEDASAAEAMMKEQMRLPSDDMYTKKIISPTVAEKLLAKDSPRRWKKLNSLVTQSEGQPAVVEESDKRPPLEIKSPEDDFGVLVDGDDMV